MPAQADLAATLTAQQKARVVDLHKQYVERQGVIKSRRAELVPHAQRTLDTDRQVGVGHHELDLVARFLKLCTFLIVWIIRSSSLKSLRCMLLGCPPALLLGYSSLFFTTLSEGVLRCRSLTPAEQVQALEAQGLLQANLDEELENVSYLFPFPPLSHWCRSRTTIHVALMAAARVDVQCDVTSTHNVSMQDD